ncbi:uncharacterized protein LOC128956157 [Oppia nitens]|uniref:uncharacterized protein LOC128956157 n=1 Tax=Oppia nitens TaxID=1686743 RepID=UPI0023DB492F|nr:uncharacterized protein LOC128956157 [Oppia nitens]
MSQSKTQKPVKPLVTATSSPKKQTETESKNQKIQTNSGKTGEIKTTKKPTKYYDAVTDMRAIDANEKILFIKSSFNIAFKDHFIQKFTDRDLWRLFIGSFGCALFVGYNWTLMAIITFISLLGSYIQRQTYERTEAYEYCRQELIKDPERLHSFLMSITSPNETNIGRANDQPCEWINDILSKFWPNINSIVQSQIDNQGFGEKSVELSGNNMYFERFTLGDKPPVLSSIHVRKSGHRKDEIVVIVRLVYFGNCLVLFSYRTTLGLKAKAGVKDVFFRGNAVIVLRPLLEVPPFIGGISVCLQDIPIIEYDGLNLANIADNKLFKRVLLNIISSYLVSPNKIFVPLIDNVNIKRELKYPQPIGLCFVEIIEAEDLPQMDAHRCLVFSGGTDSYCKLKIGNYAFSTQIVYNCMNPYFGENFSSPVHDFNDYLVIEVYDKDAVSSDDFMGCIRIKLSEVGRNRNLNGKDKWLPIGQSPSGSLHFRVAIFELSNNKRNIQKMTIAAKESSVSIPIGILSVFVHYVRNISTTDEEFDLKPVVKLKFSDQNYMTKTSKSPKKGLFYFEECVDFLCYDFAKEYLTVSVICQEMKTLTFVKVFGECSVALKDIVLKTKNMSFNKEFPIKRILKLKDVTEVKDTGIIKIYVCLKVCKYRHKVIENLKIPSNIQANIEETVDNATSLTKLYREPINTAKNPFQSIRLIANKLSLGPPNKSIVAGDITKVMPQIDENCWVKMRVKWPDRNAIHVEVLKLVQLPLDVVERSYKYTVCVRLGLQQQQQEIPKNKSKVVDNNNTNKSKSKKKTKNLKTKYTSKQPIINHSTTIAFNERLIFKISSLNNIDDHVLEVFLVTCNPRRFVATTYDYSFVAFCPPIDIPKVEFKGDPIEQWMRLQLYPKYKKQFVV